MTSVSHSKKCVFYHVPKTAGCYVEDVLVSHFDFVTYNFNLHQSHIIKFYSQEKIGSRQEFHNKSECFRIPKESLSQFFEISFVRNPYTRFISGYFYILGQKFEQRNAQLDQEKITDLSYIIENRTKVTAPTHLHVFRCQYIDIQLFDKDGNDIPLSFLGKYETLKEDMKKLCKQLGIPDNYNKENVNSNPIKYGDYRQYYTQDILEFVNEQFSEDFKRLGYEKIHNVKDLPAKF